MRREKSPLNPAVGAPPYLLDERGGRTSPEGAPTGLAVEHFLAICRQVVPVDLEHLAAGHWFGAAY